MNKVTTYAYDLGGRRIRETTVQGGVTYQDNQMAYDALGRLRWVADTNAYITIDYDKVGNRTHIHTKLAYSALTAQGPQGTPIEGGEETDRYFAYDQMNRQTLVDSATADGSVLGAEGHRLSYDKNGNRTRDEHAGVRIVQDNGQWTAVAVNIVEEYSYDNLNRLSTVVRDGALVEARGYDGASRVIQSTPGALARTTSTCTACCAAPTAASSTRPPPSTWSPPARSTTPTTTRATARTASALCSSLQLRGLDQPRKNLRKIQPCLRISRQKTFHISPRRACSVQSRALCGAISRLSRPLLHKQRYSQPSVTFRVPIIELQRRQKALFRQRGFSRENLRPTPPTPSQRIARSQFHGAFQIGAGTLYVPDQEPGEATHGPRTSVGRPFRAGFFGELADLFKRSPAAHRHMGRRNQTLCGNRVLSAPSHGNPPLGRGQITKLRTGKTGYTGNCRIKQATGVQLGNPAMQPISRTRTMQCPHP
jgi:hypothetical protein